ncbi:SCP2 sterol-binding domain-containing protein [Aquibium sp. ELW1220]|jgi:putative sterol carrier protein|uniref:SCP2 sterol-binding domain-containing protein n=1 Tax=Aquibium sp. ELW1220 TaxID=2976766 RepID=UPI0025B1564F|nr:SCP2 sterol-binding domain-containing protein [Aquibium sp. ELW1220]MDN2580566.1 SCP2 sterol-binding domain-containing protein [Aquibium sp. ELW1220]
MSLDQIASKIDQRLSGTGFDRSVKIDLGADGAILIDGESATVGDGDADCTISMSMDNFESLIAGDLNPTAAFMTGKMKVAGDMSAAMALSQAL